MCVCVYPKELSDPMQTMAQKHVKLPTSLQIIPLKSQSQWYYIFWWHFDNTLRHTQRAPSIGGYENYSTRIAQQTLT